ncbi:hypothetical protein AB0B31_15065 [Catellatospora citrea]|uniref:hypothetical protein n=1 Tax=Catellatospora citrea TaxID=53366 RepID=UPI0034056081
MIITAHEEAAIAHIMDAYRARQRWAGTGTTATPSDLDTDAKQAMIPRFAQILADMVARGWTDLLQRGWIWVYFPPVGSARTGLKSAGSLTFC